MDFDESLARLAASEASKTKQLLQDLESSLYTPVVETAQTLDNDDSPLREYSRGYDAHVETVNYKELLVWQKCFKYIHVTGIGATIAPHTIESETDSFVKVQAKVDNTSPTCTPVDSIMKIVGSKVQLVSGSNVIDDEEILAIDGIMEEYFAYDNSGLLLVDDGLESESLYDSIDPSKTGQAEVVNGLLDAVFPDICMALEPLVERVVIAGREHGISFSDNTAQDGDFGENEFRAGFFDSDDDGGGGDGMFVLQDEW